MEKHIKVGILMHINFRTLNESDIDEVQEVATTSWNDTYKETIPLHVQMRYLHEAYSKQALRQQMIHSHFFIAETKNKIVGFANFSLVNINGTTELGALYLRPNYKGKGIGTLLLEESLNYIPHVKNVVVYVEKHNKRAQDFYLRKGFIYEKEDKETFYGHHVESIQLVLRL